MRSPEWDSYINDVLSYVKFKYDHDNIRLELLEHMSDMYDDYVSSGIEGERAEKLVVEHMGDSTQVGQALNEVHNPVVGWTYRISKIALILMVIINIIPFLNFGLIGAYSVFDGYDKKTDSSLVYSMKVNEKGKLDDYNILVKEVRYYEDNTLEVRYATWHDVFSDSIMWNFRLSGYYDEFGKEYYGSGSSGAGYYSRGQSYLKDFPYESDSLIIDYKYNDREFYLEVPLDKAKERVK